MAWEGRYSVNIIKLSAIRRKNFAFNQIKKKWIVKYCSCNLNKILIANQMKSISSNLDSDLLNYDNFILLRDFSVEPDDTTTKDYCQIFDYRNTIKEKFRFKNLQSYIQRFSSQAFMNDLQNLFSWSTYYLNASRKLLKERVGGITQYEKNELYRQVKLLS